MWLPPQVVAHVVGGRPPGLSSWISAILLFGGIGALILARGRNLRIAFAAVALVGLAATVADTISRYASPTAPNLQIRLVSPGKETSPRVTVQICATNPAGRAVNPMVDGRFLLVRVDGIQEAEVQTSSVVFTLHRGRHLLTAEVNNSYHQEFQPRLLVSRHIDVSTSGGASARRSCP